MAHVKFNPQQLADAEKALAEIPGGLKTAMRLAVWDTTKGVKTDVSSRIRDRVAIKKKDIDRHLNASRFEAANKSVGQVTLFKSSRLPLKYFGARQTKAGVTYRIGKGQKRSVVPGAFVAEQIGGHAFARQERQGPANPGHKRRSDAHASTLGLVRVSRLPIIKLAGVSPYGVVKKNDMEPAIAAEGQERLNKNLNDRIRFLALKAQGKLRWQTQS